jgi:hypothetical protein
MLGAEHTMKMYGISETLRTTTVCAVQMNASKISNTVSSMGIDLKQTHRPQYLTFSLT